MVNSATVFCVDGRYHCFHNHISPVVYQLRCGCAGSSLPFSRTILGHTCQRLGGALLANIWPYLSWTSKRYMFDMSHLSGDDIVFDLGEATGNCIPNPLINETNSTGDYPICPQNEWFVVLLFAAYLAITVIVLLNLLIAIFK